MIWQSPPDQPRYARPALLAVVAASALAGLWRIDSQTLEVYYAAAVRSMALNWHNFVFGAFDPAGTVTLDKIPVGFWPQALLVRVFGPHVWAMVLPQVVEASLTLLVAYRAVRRLAGAKAALVAVVVIAATPAFVAVARGNNVEALLTLLLVLAADATARAIVDDRLSALVMAGVWVGLAFEVKMTEAWLAFLPLGLAYLVAGRPALGRRLGQLALAGAVSLAVSLVWIGLVTVVPASHRPYVDGSRHNSAWEMVFSYNGLARFGATSNRVGLQPGATGVTSSQLAVGQAVATAAPGWRRLLAGAAGRDIGWLAPAALVVLGAGLVAARHRPRTDRRRAALVLWGTWLVLFGAAFSVGSGLHAYYTIVLAPPVGALVGIGASTAWAARSHRPTRVAFYVTAAATMAYSAWLVASAPTPPGWLAPLLTAGAIVAGVAAVGAALGVEARAARVGLGAALAVALVGSAVAAASMSRRGWGPIDVPFESPLAAANMRPVSGSHLPADQVTALRQRAGSARYLVAGPGVAIAPALFATDAPVLPVGGYTGKVPVPRVTDLRRAIARGDVRVVDTLPGDDPRMRWVEQHCRRLSSADPGPPSAVWSEYLCTPADAG